MQFSDEYAALRAQQRTAPESAPHPEFPRRGAWIFVPVHDPGLEHCVRHRDELLSPHSDEGTRAELLVRRTVCAPEDGTLRLELQVYVRGRVVHPDGDPLHLEGWHWARRLVVGAEVPAPRRQER